MRPRRLVWDVLALAGLVAIWQAWVQLGSLPPLILPAPGRVFQRLFVLVSDGSLFPHLLTTVFEVLGGCALGALLGIGLGALTAVWPPVGRLVWPYVGAAQAVPKLALAPLLVVWLGFGLAPRIVITALLSFFPLFDATVFGLRSADPVQRDLFLSLRATRSQTFFKLLLPAALPSIMTGIRVALVLALVGAVVAEFIGANQGLGAMIIAAQGVMDTALMFAGFCVLTVLGLALYGLAWLADRLVRRWQFGA